MAKKSDDDLLGKTETLLNTLVDEASMPADPEGGGPDFAERLKVVEAVTKFAIVRNKLMPPAKEKSMFEGLLHELHGGTTGSEPAATKGKPGKGKAAASDRNGHDFAPFGDDGI